MSERTLGTPVPEITDLTRPFWDAAAEGRLVMQKCPHCGAVSFPPKPWCVDCGSRDIDWAEVGPRGTVYSFTISRSVAMNYPGWKEHLPVVMCLIDVDDGARMYAQVVDCSPEEIGIGKRVEVHFAEIEDGIKVPKFRPVGASGS